MTRRQPFVGGNWKCNGSKAFLESHLTALLSESNDASTSEVVVFPPSIHMATVTHKLNAKFAHVGSQNVSKTGNGAYTGEVSPEMLEDAGYRYTLIGHSERRTLFQESNDDVQAKVVACMTQSKQLCVVVCIGEQLSDRKSGKTNQVLQCQLNAFAKDVTAWDRVVIAYEPVWAIGTGVVATPEQAQEAHKYIRQWLKENINESVSECVRIIYGGSVTPANAEQLFNLADVDGFLVGGASLKSADFISIVKVTKT